MKKNAPKAKRPASKGGQKHREKRAHQSHAQSGAQSNAPKLKANIYGFHAVREAWLNPERRVQALYVTEQARAGFEDTLKEARDLERPSPITVDKKSLEKALPQGAVHQGVAILSSAPEEYSIKDIVIRAKAAPKSLVLILDQVTDPHNVGAILRSACAFGASGLVMQKKHAPMLDGVLAKTACGAVEHVPVAMEVNLSRAIEELQSEGFFVYGLDERGARNIGELGFKDGDKTALVLGAEGPGIRHNVKEHCDGLVRLPMSGPMPSINVSNAAAVALYALSASGD